jgi:hypothetical protein
MTDLTNKFAVLQQQLTNQHNALMAALSTSNSRLAAILNALGAPIETPDITLEDVVNAQNNTNDLLEDIKNAIGIPTGDATTTALGRLAAIESCVCKLAGEIPSDPDASDCDDPYTSVQTWLLMVDQGGGGGEMGITILYHVAAFATPLPEGLEESNLFNLTPPAGRVSEIKPVTTWDGWMVYVKSSSETYSDGITGGNRYPTGQWRDLTGSSSLVFTVYRPDDITVYLCGPESNGNGGEYPIEDCVILSSTMVDIVPRQQTKSEFNAIVPPQAFNTDNTITFVGFDPYSFLDNIVILDDLYGYSVGLESGDLVYIAGVAADGSTIAHIINSGQGGYTFTLHTQKVILCRETNTGTSEGPFTIQLCPPMPA